MRFRILAIAALLVTLSPCHLVTRSSAHAQPLKVRIDQVLIGFPGGNPQDTRFKSGAWAPVRVDVMSNKDYPPGQAVMIVETADSDSVQNRYVTAVPALEADKMTTLLTYVRPGNIGSETTVTLHDLVRDQKLDSARSGRLTQQAMQPDMTLYLVAGSRLPRLRRVVQQREQEQGPDDDLFDSGSRRFAYADRIEYLPTRWYGYQAADVMVMTTGNEVFVKTLLEEQNNCKEALVEWVRRGGRLVISVGGNHQFANQLLTKMQLIDCKIDGSVYHRRLALPSWVGQKQVQFFNPPGIEIAKLEPGKGVEVLAREGDLVEGGAKDKAERPLIVQAPCGMGRVMLVAFDLDRSPFTEWNYQNDFYRHLREDVEPRPVPQRVQQVGPQQPGMVVNEHFQNELASNLQDGLESFDDIPVVSFGWVALFIFLYILVVGPLDYLFLKKVVKRLELTWITFPVVVIVVSTLAYFTAYYLKGNDLKINKVDLVEVDLHGQRTYGTTWFTLFSPRIQNYTVGIEPAYPDWGPAPAGDSLNYSAVVGWMGRPENVWGGSARSGGGSLFKRAYTYAPNAAALEGVPIQVWATKTFQANWEAPFPAGQPLFTAELRRLPEQFGGVKVEGRITSNLPRGIELQGIVALYEGKAYSIKQLDSGVPRSITLGGQADPDVQPPRDVALWCNEIMPDPYHRVQRFSNRWGGFDPGGGDGSIGVTLKKAMFFKSFLQSGQQSGGVDNANLRPLDESWRVDRKRTGEVVLFARVAPKASAPAEQATAEPGSPTRLWLGKVPAPKEERPALVGSMLQRTYIRVYIPVK